MKIITIIPGFGGTFYCGNCLRDSGYTAALRKSNHESITLPIYLPLSLDYVENDENVPVFFGAIGIYLKQQYKFFRKMPKWLERFFNTSFLLKMAAKKAGSTRAEGLEEMTISMLKGHEGYQAEELEMLIDYLKNHEKPDVVHLSNALLLGLAKKIKEEVNVPVICSLQDEDVWIDAMRKDYVPGLWKLMAEKAKDVDYFVSVSSYFAKVMSEKMQIPNEKLKTVYIGLDPLSYDFSLPNISKPVIGYMSRLNKENGFGLLVDAFIKLKQLPSNKDLQLKITGGNTGDDNSFIKKEKRKLQKKGILNDVHFLNAYEGKAKKEFLSSLTLLSVPVLQGEAFGLYQIEAMASGTPIVQPALGAFPEIIDATGGGKIYHPNNAESLSKALNDLLSDKEKLEKMATDGRKSVESKFDINSLVEKMIKIYQQAIDKNN